MAEQPAFFKYVSAASAPRVKRWPIPCVAAATAVRGKTPRSRVFAILAPSANNSASLLTMPKLQPHVQPRLLPTAATESLEFLALYPPVFFCFWRAPLILAPCKPLHHNKAPNAQSLDDPVIVPAVQCPHAQALATRCNSFASRIIAQNP
jgi:hypothetical protein